MTDTPPILVRTEEWKILGEILKLHLPNCEIWAFGSRVSGRLKPGSDLDLVIISNEPLSLTVRARLSEAFSESDLPFKDDLVDWASTSPEFRKIILRHKVVVQPGNREPEA